MSERPLVTLTDPIIPTARAGELPPPLRIGEIEAWLTAGAPDRRTWEGLTRARDG